MEKLGGFVSTKPNDPLFLEPDAQGQSSFAFNDPKSSSSHFGIPTDRETLIPQEKIMDFIRCHEGELGRMREDLVPDFIRHAVQVDSNMEATFYFEPGVK